MKALIDKTVLHAAKYYQTYQQEPSPAGDFIVKSDEIEVIEDISLHKVLETLKALGADAELLVVAHSNPKGLKMPIVAGSAAAEFIGMQALLKISEGLKRGKSNGSNRSLWRAWIKEFAPEDAKRNAKVLEGEFDIADAENIYQIWQQNQTQILKIPRSGPSLVDIIALVDAVRANGVKRLEFRSCRIGTKPEELKTVAEFFKATTVVAPKEVRTFYGVAPVNIESDKQVAKRPSRRYGSLKIALQITEHTLGVFATDQTQAKGFVQQFISSSFNGSVNSIVIGGLEPAGAMKVAGRPAHIFPLETEYKNMLTMHPTPMP